MGWLDTIVNTAGTALKNNAGNIAAGVAGAVLGSGTNKGNGSQTSSISSVPAWMSDYAQQLLTQANQVASLPYQQYAGPRVAGLTQDQQDAGNMVRNNAGQSGAVIQSALGSLDPNAGQGMLAQAGNYLGNAGGNWLDNSGKYMADYSANVTNPAVAQAKRTWDEQINPSIQGTFAGNRGVGAYGSSAMLKNMTEAGSRLDTQLGENMAAYLDKGYSGGMNQFNQQNTQQGQLAQIAAQLGQQQQNMNQQGANTATNLAERWAAANGQDVNALNAVGQQQQGVNQAGMDVDYNNWLQSQNYSKDQIAYLQSILTGSTPMVDKTTTGNTSGTSYTSPLQAATQGYALWNAINSGNGSPPPTAPPSTVKQWGGIQGMNDPFGTGAQP